MHGDLGVVQRLVAEVEGVSADMLEQLLARLQGAIQLPECLRAVGYLRRLAAFPEAQLRAAFLQRREAWIAGLVGELDESNAYEFLKRLTDVYRLHLFDVVMQYRAMFADDAGSEQVRGRAVGSAGGQIGRQVALGGSCSRCLQLQQQERQGSRKCPVALTQPSSPHPHEQGGILYAWAERRITAYLQAIRVHLPRVAEGGSLASVLDHAMYCGGSLGRVGLDFRPLLAPLFEQAVLNLYAQVRFR